MSQFKKADQAKDLEKRWALLGDSINKGFANSAELASKLGKEKILLFGQEDETCVSSTEIRTERPNFITVKYVYSEKTSSGTRTCASVLKCRDKAWKVICAAPINIEKAFSEATAIDSLDLG